ncbi:transposase [Lysobacter ciconiae]|uniref:Transposase n=1 Tax=Novilysobacter ciconiae TaxID=2781022 RepID=A0A7S6UG98_9GAMM|nr:transposase [Lysobacter ciconiae]
MSSKRYTEQFRIKAVRQITDRGHSAPEVANRLGVSIHSLYGWRKRYGAVGPIAGERYGEANLRQKSRRENVPYTSASNDKHHFATIAARALLKYSG